MKHGFELRTQAFADGRIHQDIFAVAQGISQRVQSSIVDTSEAQLRQALILLGWTPPPSVGAVEVVPAEVIGQVSLVDAKTPVPDVPQATPRRLAHEVMVTSRESAAHALNHICEACREDLAHQGMALQDWAIPALRWAMLRIGVLEGDLRRIARAEARWTESRPAPL